MTDRRNDFETPTTHSNAHLVASLSADATLKHIGFTGSRLGASAAQRTVITGLLGAAASGKQELYFHHGDCQGSDAEADALARKCGAKIVVHPPLNSGLRAFCHGDETMQPLGYLARNQRIVECVSLLIAAPRTMAEQPRGGTWFTVRYAERLGREVIIVWPDGSIGR
jgi:hypothetical protein